MTIPHGVFLLGFQMASILEGLCRYALMGRGIDSMNLVYGDSFTVSMLTVAEQVLQLLPQIAVQERIIHAAEFSQKQQLIRSETRANCTCEAIVRVYIKYTITAGS